MHNHHARILCSFIVSVSALLCSGCAETIILTSEAVYNHMRGDFMGIVPDKLDAVYAASLKAVKDDMDKYSLGEHKLTAINGMLVADSAEAEKVSIMLSKTENDQTQIQIRIGALGDKVHSVYIYDCIQRHLRDPQKSKAHFYSVHTPQSKIRCP